ncbi:MAG: glucosaminidase domain-containing protein [Deltaproteobacteria bacterium]|nr:glucosaminidase domain-containing protein [Deltaproteobacteria bacterium]
MRVGPLAALERPEPAPPREVPLQRTPASRAELRAALGRAEARRTGRAPSESFLNLVTAQACLETGGGRSMYNFNFGGIKGSGPGGLTAVAGTHEYESGVRVRTRAHFRAYASLDEGAGDFLSLLHRRYPAAVAAAERGDPDGYARALHQGGYFTAPEAHYANGLRGLLGLPRRPEGTAPGAPTEAPGGSPTAAGGMPFATGAELSRVLDALTMSAVRLARPAEEEG